MRDAITRMATPSSLTKRMAAALVLAVKEFLFFEMGLWGGDVFAGGDSVSTSIGTSEEQTEETEETEGTKGTIGTKETEGTEETERGVKKGEEEEEEVEKKEEEEEEEEEEEAEEEELEEEAGGVLHASDGTKKRVSEV